MLYFCSFDLHFPVATDVEQLFMCLLAIYIPSEQIFIQILCLFLVRLFVFSWLNFRKYLVWIVC